KRSTRNLPRGESATTTTLCWHWQLHAGSTKTNANSVWPCKTSAMSTTQTNTVGYVGWNRSDPNEPWKVIAEAATEEECRRLVLWRARDGETDVAPKGKQPGTDYFLGLDFGQQHEFTALAILGRSYEFDNGHAAQPNAHFAVVHMRRWPLGTPYAAIVNEVSE